MSDKPLMLETGMLSLSEKAAVTLAVGESPIEGQVQFTVHKGEGWSLGRVYLKKDLATGSVHLLLDIYQGEAHCSLQFLSKIPASVYEILALISPEERGEGKSEG